MNRLIVISLLLFLFTDVYAGSEKTEPVEPFERGIEMSSGVFVPKGTVRTAVNFSYNTYDLGMLENDPGYSMLFGLANDLSGSMYTFGLAPQVSYFVANNFSIGVRFDYDRTSADLFNASLSIGEDMGFGIADYHTLSHTFSGSLAGRYYMQIANSKRFGLFAEMRLTGGFGQGKTWNVDEGNKYGTYVNSYNAALSIVPGISVFAHDNVAVEVAIGVLGINYSYKEQIRNQVEISAMQKSGANFKINPLSIEIGVAFYFYTGPHSKKARLAAKQMDR